MLMMTLVLVKRFCDPYGVHTSFTHVNNVMLTNRMLYWKAVAACILLIQLI